jgi:hypothetical protein
MATDDLSQDEIALLGEEILMRECPGYAKLCAELEDLKLRVRRREKECQQVACEPAQRSDGFPWGKVILAAGLAVIGVSIFRD